MRQFILNDGKQTVAQAYTIEEFPYNDILDNVVCAKKKCYLQNFIFFDIETTAIVPEEFKNRDRSKVYHGEKPWSFMYHWQAAIGRHYVYGRTWEEWTDFLDAIISALCVDENRKLMIFVHNLGFEYQHMRNIMRKHYGNESVFATQKRKPIKISYKNGLEFRCTWKLTNMSLAKACQNEQGCKIQKSVGDLDYRILRYSDIEINDTEFGYCMNDVACGEDMVINRLINEGDDLCSLPLTSTGYVRRYCRKHCLQDKRYQRRLWDILPGEKVYTMLLEARRGGDTHANRFMAGRVKEDCDSYDLKSSYPYQMLTKKYPMTKFIPYGEVYEYSEFLQVLGKYACIFRIVFKNLRLKKNISMPYISFSKQIGHDGTGKILDNGRLIYDPAMAMTITDIDFWIIKEQYTWEEIAVSNLYISHYDYLPQAYRDCVFEIFKEKCELEVKRDEAKAAGNTEEYQNLSYLYAKIKNRLNGLFGMAYTQPTHDLIYVDENGEWKEESPDIKEALEKNNHSYNTFLSYAWGLWVAAWGRHDLNKLRDSFGQENVIYQDTDSTKGINADEEKIKLYNMEVKRICEEREIVVDIKGRKFYIGTAECETSDGRYKNFKTLGAKKYCYTDSDGIFHITISGVPKKAGAEEMVSIDHFTPGFQFCDSGCSTTFFDDSTEIIPVRFGDHSVTRTSNVTIVDNTYTLGITGEYQELLGLSLIELAYGG